MYDQVMTTLRNVDRRRLPMWTIYDRPKEFPAGYLARLWYSLPQPEATALVIPNDDLEVLRDYFAEIGCTLLPRSEADQPNIVESWLL
jgi:hypothetical protein